MKDALAGLTCEPGVAEPYLQTFTEQKDDGGSLGMRKSATVAASSASMWVFSLGGSTSVNRSPASHRENETMSGLDSD